VQGGRGQDAKQERGEAGKAVAGLQDGATAAEGEDAGKGGAPRVPGPDAGQLVEDLGVCV